MRVALFTETYLPYINGVVTHVKILKEGLEELGHTVLIVTADPNAEKHNLQDGILRCPAKEFKHLYGYGLAFPISPTRQQLIADFKPDILHIHNEFGVGVTALQAADRLNVPLVYTLHTLYDDYIYYISPKHLTGTTKALSHRYFRYLASKAAILTGPSKKCADFFSQIGIEKPCHVIPNSVETAIFNPENIPQEAVQAVREKYGIAKDALLSVFVGRLGKEKAIDTLLEFWKEQIKSGDNMHLMVVGDGPYKEEFENLATALGIEDQVTFTGAVLHPDLPPYFAAADVYLTASLSEMYSISMLEGMAAGLPAVQRLDPDNRDQITEGVNGFIYETPAEMANILRAIQQKTPEQRDALTHSVMDSVKGHNASGIANYMLNLYQEALDKKLNTVG